MRVGEAGGQGGEEARSCGKPVGSCKGLSSAWKWELLRLFGLCFSLCAGNILGVGKVKLETRSSVRRLWQLPEGKCVLGKGGNRGLGEKCPDCKYVPAGPGEVADGLITE